MTPQQAARARVRLAAAHERGLASDVLAWLRRVYGIAADMVEHGQVRAALAVPEQHEGELRSRYNARIAAATAATNETVLGHLDRTKKAADDSVSAYLRRYGVRRVAGIRKITAKRIRKVIADGKRDGLTVQEIADRMRKVTRSRAIRQRAESIAQTEIHAASERAAMLTAQRSGLQLVKVWASMEDDRVRPAHAAADGQTVPVKEPFRVGGEALMFPGDPTGSPENVINCRCVAIYTTAPLALGLPRQWRPSRRPATAEAV